MTLTLFHQPPLALKGSYTSLLSAIITSHHIKHHFCVSDCQVQDSKTPDNVQTLLTKISICLKTLKTMKNNKLLLNDDKTEAIPIGTCQNLTQLTCSLSLQINSITISD